MNTREIYSINTNTNTLRFFPYLYNSPTQLKRKTQASNTIGTCEEGFFFCLFVLLKTKQKPTYSMCTLLDNILFTYVFCEIESPMMPNCVLSTIWVFWIQSFHHTFIVRTKMQYISKRFFVIFLPFSALIRNSCRTLWKYF